MRSALAPLACLLALAGCADPISYPTPDAGTDAGSAFTCLPNLDGKIDASELSAVLGISVNYVDSPAGEIRTVDVAGQTDGNGNHTWDFSQSFADDILLTIAAQPLSGKWYQGSFPSGQWAAQLDQGDTTEGIYSADGQALYLQGVASVDSTPATKTLIVYNPPVALYRFPLAPGSAWTSTGTVMGGYLKGLPYAGVDTYAVTDDAVGEVGLHDYIFTQAHRVRTTVTLSPSAGQTQVSRQVAFVFECFGEVVHVASQPGETSDNFTMAAEVRRLSNP